MFYCFLLYFVCTCLCSTSFFGCPVKRWRGRCTLVYRCTRWARDDPRFLPSVTLCEGVLSSTYLFFASAHSVLDVNGYNQWRFSRRQVAFSFKCSKRKLWNRSQTLFLTAIFSPYHHALIGSRMHLGDSTYILSPTLSNNARFGSFSSGRCCPDLKESTASIA